MGELGLKKDVRCISVPAVAKPTHSSKKHRLCRFSRICAKYKPIHTCCNNDHEAANYYGPGRAAGCFRYMLDIVKHIKTDAGGK